METIRSIIRGDLPPVGNPIVLSQAACSLDIPGYHGHWLDSGTSALALAILDARTAHPCPKPEVILPAYGCPDLVAACVYAGCIAKLVDIERDGCGYDLDQLQQALTANTVAVVGVNFLGIRENWAGILAILSKWDFPVATIEDNAQWFPDLAAPEIFYSDHIIFSFGKGKPISLLGGGALFSRAPALISTLIKERASESSLLLHAKFRTFNFLLTPSIYWFLNHNPFFKPGATAYRPLNSIRLMDEVRLNYLAPNYYQYADRHSEIAQTLYALLQVYDFTDHLYPRLNTANCKLLRFPMLCNSLEQRDSLLNKLNAAGLGATAMYQKALADLDCPKALINTQLKHENARNFAQRLITLPCHSGVHPKHLSRLRAILDEQVSAKAALPAEPTKIN